MAKNQETEAVTLPAMSPETQALLAFMMQQQAESDKRNALLISELQKQNAAQNALILEKLGAQQDRLVDTLINPKMSDQQKDQLDMERAATQEANFRKRMNEKFAQDTCDHLQGMNGDQMTSQTPTWQRHQYAAGYWGAICKKCGKNVFDCLPEQRVDFIKARPQRRAYSTAGQNFQYMQAESREAAIERAHPSLHERSLYRQYGLKDHALFVRRWGMPSQETLDHFGVKV